MLNYIATSTNASDKTKVELGATYFHEFKNPCETNANVITLQFLNDEDSGLHSFLTFFLFLIYERHAFYEIK